eukprot:Colp12_sorted_trinity150504_noHs@18607
MDQAMEIVAKHCEQQIRAYQECVEKHPTSWERTCQSEQQDVAACSAQYVKPILEVREKCAASYTEYYQCLSEHQQDPEKWCEAPFEKFFACADKVLGDGGSNVPNPAKK